MGGVKCVSEEQVTQESLKYSRILDILKNIGCTSQKNRHQNVSTNVFSTNTMIRNVFLVFLCVEEGRKRCWNVF